MNLKFLLLNPAFIFGFFLLFSLSSTYLQWSDLFRELKEETIYIYIISSFSLILISFIFHYKLLLNKIFINGNLLYSFKKSKNDNFLFITLILFFAFEVVYSGFLPILLDNYSDILDLTFGIPIFHGLYLGFLSYISVVYFQKYVATRKKKYILYILLINVIFLFMGRRGIIVFHVLSYMFLYLYYYLIFKKINFKFILKSILILFVFFYSFNLLGNIRLGDSSNDYILKVGKASKDFKESLIPNSVFFGYLYISSPVSIFDANLDNNQNRSYLDFAKANLIPDFIMKRFGFENKIEDIKINGFTAGGVFIRPYLYIGITGIFLIIIYYIILYVIVMKTVYKNKKRALVLLSMFLSMSSLLLFSNLLNYSGYVLQIYFALLFKDLVLFKYGNKYIFSKRKKYEKV